MKIALIRPQDVPYLPRAYQLLTKVNDYLLPRCDALDLIQACSVGEKNLWVVFEDTDDSPGLHNENIVAAAVTSVTPYPKCTMLTITALAGDRMEEWLTDLHQVLHKYRAAGGHLGLEEWGRDGWVRRLTKLGFRKSHILMEDFGDGQGF